MAVWSKWCCTEASGLNSQLVVSAALTNQPILIDSVTFKAKRQPARGRGHAGANTLVPSDQSQKVPRLPCDVPLRATPCHCSMSSVGGRPWSVNFCFRRQITYISAAWWSGAAGVCQGRCLMHVKWCVSAVLSRFEICAWAPKSVKVIKSNKLHY